MAIKLCGSMYKMPLATSACLTGDDDLTLRESNIWVSMSQGHWGTQVVLTDHSVFDGDDRRQIFILDDNFHRRQQSRFSGCSYNGSYYLTIIFDLLQEKWKQKSIGIFRNLLKVYFDRTDCPAIKISKRMQLSTSYNREMGHRPFQSRIFPFQTSRTWLYWARLDWIQNQRRRLLPLPVKNPWRPAWRGNGYSTQRQPAAPLEGSINGIYPALSSSPPHPLAP